MEVGADRDREREPERAWLAAYAREKKREIRIRWYAANLIYIILDACIYVHIYTYFLIVRFICRSVLFGVRVESSICPRACNRVSTRTHTHTRLSSRYKSTIGIYSLVYIRTHCSTCVATNM